MVLRGSFFLLFHQCQERVARYDQMLQQTAEEWKRAPDVRKLQVLRGISFFTAVGIVAELGDLHVVTNPRITE